MTKELLKIIKENPYDENQCDEKQFLKIEKDIEVLKEIQNEIKTLISELHPKNWNYIAKLKTVK